MSIGVIYHRDLTDVITSAFKDSGSLSFNMTPFTQRWDMSDGKVVDIFSEAYTSADFLEAHEEVNALPRNPDDILEQLPDNFQGQYTKSHGEPATKETYTHCKCELFQAVWALLLDAKFMDAYCNGIIIQCADGIVHKVFPRFFSYSADYPEKVLLAGIKFLGKCPCPRCLVKKQDLAKMGMKRDMRQRVKKIRVDNEDHWRRIKFAWQLMFEKGVYCAVSTFGHGTIRKFNKNVSAMKRLAARDFEDLLQVTCSYYDTKELPQETSIRNRCVAALASKQDTAPTRDGSSGSKQKKLNLTTYKYHALADYPNTIRQKGTTDNYNTQTGELQHRYLKRHYPRTSKNIKKTTTASMSDPAITDFVPKLKDHILASVGSNFGEPQRMDVLFVHWFGRDTTRAVGVSARQLYQVRFLANDDTEFVDWDMFMHFRGGGLGHEVPREWDSYLQSDCQAVQEENETFDVEKEEGDERGIESNGSEEEEEEEGEECNWSGEKLNNSPKNKQELEALEQRNKTEKTTHVLEWFCNFWSHWVTAALTDQIRRSLQVKFRQLTPSPDAGGMCDALRPQSAQYRNIPSTRSGQIWPSFPQNSHFWSSRA
ncbi:hypothetical protein SERLADRAFT_412306 [Serpula lacrymans var. lacrymans S7.9]|uniref:Uncharacterized protein n=1 Tax=Serpula lacrymans var. lacrymans (strain S7.9) TaxID=578457 RepID=F8NDJ7_SERL9|nr:uncharacterized protein SERLADRAFT_412306 [Serpula lacrymans var. lacrymans S7.9]EGO30230.1 hypothetical protein SERLADRAFT_412306 [Serpula lacrymans var. lacrymans S7.9]